MHQKAQQHTDLVKRLIEAGWKEHKIHLLDPLLFGIGGCLYTHTKDILTGQLHIPSYRCTPTLSQIQKDTAHTAVQIVGTRRTLEVAQGIQVRPNGGRRPP